MDLTIWCEYGRPSNCASLCPVWSYHAPMVTGSLGGGTRLFQPWSWVISIPRVHFLDKVLKCLYSKSNVISCGSCSLCLQAPTDCAFIAALSPLGQYAHTLAQCRSPD